MLTEFPTAASADLRPIDPNPGSELDPVNFVGRASVSERAMVMLKARQNILVGDPRRMGKSFWIAAFSQQVNASGAMRVVAIDYQGADTVEEFLRVTVERLSRSQRVPERFLQYVAGLFDNTDATAMLGPVTLKKAARDSTTRPSQLLENILIHLDDCIAADAKAVPLVIAMDEVPDAIMAIAAHDPDGAATLLRRLRHLRHAATHIRWIVAGSVGFHHALARCQAGGDVINDLDVLPLGPLDATDSATLARRLALGIRRPMDDDAVEALFAATDGMPYLIQKLADTMRYGDNNQRITTKITAGEIQMRFAEFLTNRDQGGDVASFVSRIDRYYGKNATTAFDILDQIATGPPAGRRLADLPETLRTREDFAKTLRNLIDDHYLVVKTAGEGELLAWRLNVIRVIYMSRRLTRG